MYKKILTVILILIMLLGYKAKAPVNSEVKTESEIASVKSEILSLSDNFDSYSKSFIDPDFLDWLESQFGADTLFEISKTLKIRELSNEDWLSVTGNSVYVIKDMYSGALDKDSPNYRNDIRVINSNSENTTIRIIGDVSFADNWHIAPEMDKRGKGIYGILSEETVSFLKDSDILLANNEFTYSNRGTPLSGKLYTFRAKPERVNCMKEIGVDIVSLANNHAYDYGAEAFADTLQTLREADLPYIGGGKDISEVSKPYYFIVNGRKYAFSAATRAEKNILTPEAGENSSGVMRIYDPSKYIEVIKSAEAECDYNIVYLHWGAEGSHNIENGLYDTATRFIDSGADIVVGAHAHILQGIQYYNGVPIVYNLGNFIFNSKTIDTGILEININSKGIPEYKFIPAIQQNCYTQIVSGQEKARILRFMESLSINVSFDENGVFTEK